MVHDFWPPKVDFGPMRLDLRLSEYIFILWESILCLLESIVGLYESILGFESRFWAIRNNVRPLGVNFGVWEFILGLVVGL